MAAPVIQTHAETRISAQSVWTLTAPSGVAVDDVLVAILFDNALSGASGWTASGWTAATGLDTGFDDFGLMWKRAVSADTSAVSYAFTTPSSSSMTGVGTILRISGAQPTGTPVVASGSGASMGTSGNNPLTLPSLTPTVVDNLYVAALGAESGTATTWTTTSACTQVLNNTGTTYQLAVWQQSLSTTSATGTFSFSCSDNNAVRVGYGFLVLPVPAPAPVTLSLAPATASAAASSIGGGQLFTSVSLGLSSATATSSTQLLGAAVTPTFVGTVNSGTAATVATATANVAVPGLAAGDLLLLWCQVMHTAGLTYTTPAGWTLLTSTNSDITTNALFSKIADGTETTVAVSLSGAGEGIAFNAMAYRSVNPTAPVTAAAAAQDVTPPNTELPSITGLNNGLSVGLVTMSTNISNGFGYIQWATPSGWTQRALYNGDALSYGRGEPFTLFDKALTADGPNGGGTAVENDNVYGGIWATVTLAPSYQSPFIFPAPLGLAPAAASSSTSSLTSLFMIIPFDAGGAVSGASLTFFVPVAQFLVLSTLGPSVLEFDSTSTLFVPDNTTDDLLISVDADGVFTSVDVGVYITMTFDGDLELRLIAPDGTSVLLSMQEGGGGQNYGSPSAQCVFSDSASTAIGAGSPPYVGVFLPEESLSILSGKPLAGTWTFRAIDHAGGDQATVQMVSLFFTVQAPAAGGTGGALDLFVPMNPVYDEEPTPDPPPPPPDPPPPAPDVGIVILPPPASVGHLLFEVTTLYQPAIVDSLGRVLSYTGGDVVHVFDDFDNSRVEINLNDQRTAQLDLDLYNAREARWAINPWKFMLRVKQHTPYHTHCVFWGPISTPEVGDDKVTLNAVGPEIRLIHHYIERSDDIITGHDMFTGDERWNIDVAPTSVIDHRGFFLLRDSANNGPRANRAYEPVLGIGDGDFNDPDVVLGPDPKKHPEDAREQWQPHRGDNVWEMMQGLATHEFKGRDFEIQPATGTPGLYARLNVFQRQGNSPYIDPTVVFHDGWGSQNAAVTYQPGARIFTEAHVMNSQGGTVVGAKNYAAAAIYGDYEIWKQEQTPTQSRKALQARANRIVKMYGFPRDEFTVKPNIDSGYWFREDFNIGDTIGVSIVKGALQAEARARIHQVVLSQQAGGHLQYELDVKDDPRDDPWSDESDIGNV